jgi:hypothetical protein
VVSAQRIGRTPPLRKTDKISRAIDAAGRGGAGTGKLSKRQDAPEYSIEAPPR